MSRFKYPHTLHLPQSRSRTDDDHVLTRCDHFEGMTVVLTEKRDGENASLYYDHYHARSLDSVHHVSRDWIKAYWNSIRYEIPKNWRICGENLYAQHSIRYEDLDSYFEGFSIWDNHNMCLSWEETVEWFNLLDIVSVPVLYKGPYYKGLIEETILKLDFSKQEGFVIRNVEQFHYCEFYKNVAKFVRPKHCQTSDHWMHSEIVANGLRDRHVDTSKES